MNHTPTPWKIDRILTHNAAPIITAETCWRDQPRIVAKAMYHSGSEDPEVHANAEFIVRACNSHDALLEALKILLDEFNDVMNLYHLPKDASPALRSARAAISKATE